MAGPAALVVPALKRHTATVICAHGLGDTGSGCAIRLTSTGSSSQRNWRRRNKFEEVSFVFPNAPNIPITVNMGMRMPGWYDITNFDSINRSEDEPGIARSAAYVHSLIDDEIAKGISSDRIVLGGFSQGGALSIFSGLTCPKKLGGVFGLSSYLLLEGKIRDKIPADNPNKDTPIFMGHGDIDPLVKYEWGRATAEKLREWGWTVDFKTYPNLPHSAAPQEIDDLEEYVLSRLPPLGDKKL